MDQTLMNEALERRIRSAGVVAVVTLDCVDDALPLAEALVKGGISAIELTLRTPVALAAIEEIAPRMPELLVGAGTVLTAQQAREVSAAGVAFAVAPGLNPRVVEAAKSIGLPFAPGVCTPSDIEVALELGCRILKFFPAEPAGGRSYLRTIAAPYAHRQLRFIPLGGVSAENAPSYLSESSVLALGGSWIAPRADIQQRRWSDITARARTIREIIAQVRAGQPKSNAT